MSQVPRKNNYLKIVLKCQQLSEHRFIEKTKFCPFLKYLKMLDYYLFTQSTSFDHFGTFLFAYSYMYITHIHIIHICILHIYILYTYVYYTYTYHTYICVKICKITISPVPDLPGKSEESTFQILN